MPTIQRSALVEHSAARMFGLVNDIAAYRAAISRGELPRADILVLVLDATQLLNRTELAFLRDALSAVGGLQDSGARLLLVVNRIDLVGEDDRPKLREYLARELAVLAGTRESGETLETFETDARGALRDPASSAHGVVEVRRLRERLFALAQTRGEILPARVRASRQLHPRHGWWRHPPGGRRCDRW